LRACRLVYDISVRPHNLRTTYVFAWEKEGTQNRVEPFRHPSIRPFAFYDDSSKDIRVSAQVLQSGKLTVDIVGEPIYSPSCLFLLGPSRLSPQFLQTRKTHYRRPGTRLWLIPTSHTRG
jgi:hypothetical protein